MFIFDVLYNNILCWVFNHLVLRSILDFIQLHFYILKQLLMSFK